jgi:hypothetical protein
MAAPQGPISSPMVDVNIYRPGSFLALAMLLVPLIVALAGATSYALLGEHIPVWIPLLLLLWIPCLGGLWLLMKSVRTTPVSIGVGRPWQRWQEVSYADIERIEQRGPSLRILTLDGTLLSFTPFLLRDGTRLEVGLLLRLPPHVIVGKLRRRSQELITGDIHTGPEGTLAGTLRIRARPRWTFATLLLALASIAGAVVAILTLSLALAIPLAIVLVALGLCFIVIFGWLLREVEVNEKGVTVVGLVNRRPQKLAWSEVVWLEEFPGQLAIRLRGPRRLRLAGPRLLKRSQAEVLQAFLLEYVIERGALRVPRRWLF